MSVLSHVSTVCAHIKPDISNVPVVVKYGELDIGDVLLLSRAIALPQTDPDNSRVPLAISRDGRHNCAFRVEYSGVEERKKKRQ